MFYKDKCGSTGCGILGVVLSIIFGVVIGLLFSLGFIPFIVTAAWISFGLSVFILGFLLIYVLVAGITKCNALIKCLSNNTTCLLVGIIGTLISSIAALAIVLSTEFISVAVLVGIGAFFFALMLTGLIGFINCVLCNSYE